MVKRQISWLEGIYCPIICIVMAAGSFGCARDAELAYRPSDEAQELPELHREQLAAALLHHFGTPLQPRFNIAAKTDGEVDLSDEEPPATDALLAVDRLAHGGQVYRRRCASCHGVTGDGAGVAAAYLNPRPRDYRRGVFKFISTPRGSKPRRQDLVRIIRRGAKGTSMPSFRWLPDGDLNAVVDYVLLLSMRGELEYFMAAIEVPDEYDEEDDIDPEHFVERLESIRGQWIAAAGQVIHPDIGRVLPSEESIELGRAAFQAQACTKCHGTDGRGQTEWLSPEFIALQQSLPADEQVALNRDDWGLVAPAADLTAGMLHGGRRPIDVYRRVHAGINGTPMPAFGSVFQSEPETIWHLTNFILSVVDGGEFRPLALTANAAE